MNQDNKIRKIAGLGLLSALAIIFGYVETLLPVFTAIPGIKLGLANLVTVFALYTASWKEAAMVSAIRIVVIGFLFGNLFSILFSLAGAGFSLACMVWAKRYAGFSVVGVSILGGVTHNLGQILVAVLVVENANLFYYLPPLMIAGLITGMLIGMVSGEVLKRTVPKTENKEGKYT